jgi:hypothetical protein
VAQDGLGVAYIHAVDHVPVDNNDVGCAPKEPEPRNPHIVLLEKLIVGLVFHLDVHHGAGLPDSRFDIAFFEGLGEDKQLREEL